MAYSLKENLMKEDRLSGGHRMCAGCGSPIAVRTVLRALNPEDKAVVCSATSCLEVSTFMYPYTAWKDSFIHNAFENAAATISGVETAYRAMKKRGKLDDTYKFIAFGGDGGTYDIGFQSLSGAMERGHDMVYVCYDNEAYMNTGIQRSSSTPHFADTTTTPQGTVIPGKMQNIFEAIIGGREDFTVTNMGEDGRKVFPVLGGLFLFIAVQNILGLIPACDAPTANINTNIGMALFVFLYYNYQGIKRWHGHYIHHFMGPMLPLAPFMMILEFISHLARPLSLTLRLFGNIRGEEIVLLLFFLMAPLVSTLPIYFLFLLAKVLQAFIFYMLALIYLKGAMEPAH